MEQIKDGGPAFPVPMEDRHCGMTLRDYFAAKAMHGAIASPGTAFDDMDAEQLALYAYALADAMIAAREGKSWPTGNCWSWPRRGAR